MNGYFDQVAETASVDQLRQIQTDRLKRVVAHLYAKSPYQRARFDAIGLKPGDIKSADDITKLPWMDKCTFRDSYPMGLSCVEPKDVAEIHMSSGSTGTPVVMPYTLADLHQWGQCMARCLVMAGTRKGDVVQITPSLGLFNGGFGFYHGARELGCLIVPTGAGNTPRQINLARDFKTRVLTGVVSYGIRVMEVMEEMKAKLPDLKIGIFGAETFSDAMKQKLRSGLGIEVYDIYGMTETGGVGTLGQDCCDHSGNHVWEDHYIVEVLDPATQTPVRDGEVGELTITSLTREALPVLRFRTGDLTRVLSRGKCACGRTHLKTAPITGRVDDMLIVKGVNFFPKQVEQALMEIPGVLNNYQIIIDETHGVKDVTINVEAQPHVTGYMVEKHLKEKLGFSPKGDVFPPGGLPRQEGKAKRVFHKDATGIH